MQYTNLEETKTIFLQMHNSKRVRLTDRFYFFRWIYGQQSAKIRRYGAIIPLSCIVNDGGQDPSILNNGCVEGYGEANKNWIGLG